ncbi:hypothetical protein DH86_00001274 [Scytalidium sp. 3C]|nr:hypothetical protein DH86_00001274 [Scytalidium sp. 3C]
MKSSVILVAAAASLAAAQNFGNEPACAIPCLSSAIVAAGCALTDEACQCGTGQPAIQTAITPCLLSACNESDLLLAASVGGQLCSVFSASLAAASATTTAAGSSAPKSSAASPSVTPTSSGSAQTVSSSPSGGATTVTAVTTSVPPPSNNATSVVSSSAGAGGVGSSNFTISAAPSSSSNSGSSASGSSSASVPTVSKNVAGQVGQGMGSFAALLAGAAALL